MPREYKRKKLAEEQSLDLPPKKIKKQINSSERWRAKKVINQQLQEEIDEIYFEEIDKWNKEVRSWYEAQPCAKCFYSYAIEDKLKTTFIRLGIVVLIDYNRLQGYCEHNQADTATF